MNGKVNGRVFVGNSPRPEELSNNDLHSYVVPNDGRAYVAISNISDGLGPSLLPLSSLGGIIGWAFALEQPGYKNGFSLIGEGDELRSLVPDGRFLTTSSSHCVHSHLDDLCRC